ncbi:MAG TPA: hypothetical protein VGI91_03525 [Steroidobacteraceae bacterium]|jgi:hypothetical protein
MSLEWARARLLQHREALRKLCEAQASARAQQLTLRRQQQRHAELVDLKPQRPARQAAEKATVLKFERPRRRRRA